MPPEFSLKIILIINNSERVINSCTKIYKKNLITLMLMFTLILLRIMFNFTA